MDFFKNMPYQIGHHIDLLMYNGKLDQPIVLRQFHF